MPIVKLNLKPSTSDLRQFGYISLGAFGLLGALIYWHVLPLARLLGTATPAVAYVLWGLGGAAAVLSLVAPRANRALYVVLMLVAYPIGLVVSHAILAVFFFGVLTPLGLIFRLLGRDALQRGFDPPAQTYWIARKPNRDLRRYFSQF
jgi:hypothetical protein